MKKNSIFLIAVALLAAAVLPVIATAQNFDAPEGEVAAPAVTSPSARPVPEPPAWETREGLEAAAQIVERHRRAYNEYISALRRRDVSPETIARLEQRVLRTSRELRRLRAELVRQREATEELTRRVNDLNTKVGEVKTDLGTLTDTVKNQGDRIGTVEAGLTNAVGRLDGFEQNLEVMNTRLDSHATRLGTLNTRVWTAIALALLFPVVACLIVIRRR